MRRFVCFVCFCFEFLAVTAVYLLACSAFCCDFVLFSDPLSAVVIVSMGLKVMMLREGDDIVMDRLSL